MKSVLEIEVERYRQQQALRLHPSSNTRKARQRGHAAAEACEPITANPYKKPVQWIAWRMGYIAYCLAENPNPDR